MRQNSGGRGGLCRKVPWLQKCPFFVYGREIVPCHYIQSSFKRQNFKWNLTGKLYNSKSPVQYAGQAARNGLLNIAAPHALTLERHSIKVCDAF